MTRSITNLSYIVNTDVVTTNKYYMSQYRSLRPSAVMFSYSHTCSVRTARVNNSQQITNHKISSLKHYGNLTKSSPPSIHSSCFYFTTAIPILTKETGLGFWKDLQAIQHAPKYHFLAISEDPTQENRLLRQNN